MQIKIDKIDKQGKKVEIMCGYDKPLDYVFMCIFDEEGELIFDNLSLENALAIKDFSFFVKIAKEEFGICLDEQNIKINAHKLLHT